MHRLATAFLLIVAATLASTSAGAAAPRTQLSAPTAAIHDPSVGPHAIDEARHATTQRDSLAPATSVPMALGSLGGGRMAAPLALAPSTPFHREVFGFAPYWSLSQYSTWDYRLLSTLAYFGITLTRDGTIDTTVSGYTEWNSQSLVNMVNSAHASGDKVVVVVKNFQTENINRIVTDPALTQVAIDNTINAIASKNLDGVNIDFEGQTSATYPYLQSGLVSFMMKLSQQVHARWPSAEVSIDTYTGAASWDGGIFKIGDLAPVVDAFFIMAYDMVFENQPGVAGANAPLTHYTFNDTDSVAQYLTKAPASKILLGVPYYGYKWSTTGNGPNAATSSGAIADTYANIVSELQCALPSRTDGWDNFAQSPWVSWYSPASADPCGGNFGSWRELYYDSAASLGIKYDLVNQNNLRGAGMWALGYDGGATELWNAIAQKLTTVTNWDSLSGLTNAAPALASPAAGRLDVFTRGNDNALWHQAWNGTSWQGWESLGGVLTSGPAAVASSPTRIDIFARGGDNAVWHRTWNGTTFSGWDSIGGNITSAAAVAAWSSTHLDLFVRGTDNALWHRAWNGTAWGAWEGLGGVLASDPAAVSYTAGRIDVFVRGADGAIWQRSYEMGGWSTWTSLGGYFISAPAVATCGYVRLDIFGVGADRALWRKTFTPTDLGGWHSQGGQWASGPGAVCQPGATSVDVLERAQDSTVWHTSVAQPS